MKKNTRRLDLPEPSLQVDFSVCLATARKSYLIDALSETVATLDITTLDREISQFVPHDYVQSLARRGLRAELVFPVPLLLSQNPRLLAYYRLLLGFSQKLFYDSGTGANMFKSMESTGTLPKNADITFLVKELIQRLCMLMDGIGARRITRDLIDDLTLLTLGPQLRGGANVKKGSAAIRAVFDMIQSIVKEAVVLATEKRLEIHNAAGRTVLIEFAPDPDIVIRELMTATTFRNIIAIEIKGGTDFSNIHNRIGEAEKSHQKARNIGYVECWTIINVAGLDLQKAKRESPSTNHFFQLGEIISDETEQAKDFRSRIIALTGIA